MLSHRTTVDGAASSAPPWRVGRASGRGCGGEPPRVLAQRTLVVLLDEPTAALDLRHQQPVLRLARGLAARGHAVLAGWHDLNLAARAHRVAVVHGGRMAADGPPADVLTADLRGAVYRHPVQVVPHPDDGRPLVVATDAADTPTP